MSDLTISIGLNEEELRQQLLDGFDKEFLSHIDKDYEVTCEDTAKQALSYALQSRKLKSRIEDSRKEIVRPHIDFQKAVMKFSKDISDKLDSIEKNLHVKIAVWMKEQKENPFSCVDEIQVEDGKILLKNSWDFRIEDETKIPREYMLVDEAAIEKAVNNGIRNIPGVKIFSYETTQLRVKN
ncbi:MAG: hypothetical protein C5B43_01300 [Verrucomicrobia bacterium]|nr:MAG: hypothetical protein C5B43_01300 [Verrucomicrobiota bacterium]